MNDTEDTPSSLVIELKFDQAINYAFQQNSIPIIKELRIRNDATPRKNILIRISCEPSFAIPVELRVQGLGPSEEFNESPIDIKLSHDFLSELNEKVAGWLKVEVLENDIAICSRTEPVSLLARNEWCGLASLAEILAAFVLPNDAGVVKILSRAAEILREHTGRAAFNGYQDKNRKRVWEQAAAIYKAIGELGLRYIIAPASFENTGQKVRFPSEILSQRFANCLDLSLLFGACFEQVGLHPLVLMHEGHAYSGIWLEERTLHEPSSDDLQHLRKLESEDLISVFECTLAANERPGTLNDAELLAKPHLETSTPFRVALDIRCARIAKICPLPIGNAPSISATSSHHLAEAVPALGIGERDFVEPLNPSVQTSPRSISRIDLWKSRLLDLTLRNRLLNFRETVSTIRILSATPEHVEDELAAEHELSLQPKPSLLSESDPRSGISYTREQRQDALADHLREELRRGRLHTNLDGAEHVRRLTELFRAARSSLEENGTNTLFAAVGSLEWRETEHSERVLRAPLLLIPVELKRKSVLEGFNLRRIDEETRLNFTLIEMLRQHFHKVIPGLDPLPEDESGVDVGLVFRLFRDAVRELPGWEVKTEIWLGQFSFAKFLLWKDLTDRLHELTRNRIVHHLVNEAGKPYSNPSEDIHPNTLDDRFHPKDIFCPRSADSSQLSAVLAAAAGHDFVLEGPPGTGKSQTITNIIAHCLAQGMRVLFVAEKRAALDVVFRRLRESGLEPFCLELHSNKAGKADVVSQFDKSLKYTSDDSGTDWEIRARELERLRDSLNAYARALHRRYACGISTYQCLDYLLPRLSEPIVRLESWTDIEHTSVESLERARHIAQALQKRSRPLLPLLDHPLSELACDEWSPDWADKALAHVRELLAISQSAIESTVNLCTWLDWPKATVSREELTRLARLADTLILAKPVGPGFATTAWPELSAHLERWIKLVNERIQLRNELRPVFEASRGEGAQVCCENWPPDAATQVFRQSKDLEILAREAQEAACDLLTWLNSPSLTTSRKEMFLLIDFVDTLLKPMPVGEGFAQTAWQDWIADFDRWIELVRERLDIRAKLVGYDESKLLQLDLDRISEKWQSAQNGWLFARKLRIATVRRRLRSTRTDRIAPETSKLGQILQDSIRLRDLNLALSAADTAEWLIGTAWNHGEPQLDQLIQIRQWAATFHARLSAIVGTNNVWRTQVCGFLAELFNRGPASYSSGTEIGNRLNRYHESNRKFAEAYEAWVSGAAINREMLDNAADHLPATRSTVKRLLASAPRLREVDEGLQDSLSTAEQCLGTIWNKGEPSTEALSTTAEWGRKLHASLLACAGDNLYWLSRLRDLIARGFAEGVTVFSGDAAIGKRLSRFTARLSSFNEAFEKLALDVRLDASRSADAPNYLTTIVHLCERLQKAWPQIREWCFWQKARTEAIETGLGPLVATLESQNGDTTEIPTLFERGFRRGLLFAAIEKEPALRKFFGQEQNELVDRFRQVDENVSHLASELIRARLAAGIPRDQLDSDIPKNEIGVLRREIAKKTRHLPVRQLLARIPTLLPRLKPCVLMSPLSVAQYLEPSHDIFDVVIFDEASQIPVWDAIGAIARGKQLIVVGDPKQLPPTNFFNPSTDEEDLAPEEFKDLESILDELMTHGLRHKRLQWHYRSRHEGLIAFSNRQYYENDLLTFPSPEHALGGVRFKHLPDARYDKGKSRTNRIEAAALVEELVARLMKADEPPRSYGVVTFSLAQQQLIENLLDDQRRLHPEIEVHFGDEPPIEGEPVFVKNLENVQGDERDVVLFSICYGQDESGRVSMNFGPLNRDGGERRLNVAITRAKHEVLVFSGLRADQIDLARTRARGIRDLKQFLDYAERGPIALSSAVTGHAQAAPESEFERMVADELRKAGYEVYHQVGCSGYRIDLGITDPSKPGRYILGVECDGATYHRAATARDRDKLRQLVLEGLGWTLYRIWSTDWWHDKDKEMQKLLAFIRDKSC